MYGRKRRKTAAAGVGACSLLPGRKSHGEGKNQWN